MSQPGVDVMTAAQTQLIFDGAWAGAAKFIRGTVSGVRSDAGTSSHTVMYGKTYTTKPFVLALLGGGVGWREGPGVYANIKTFGDSAMFMTDLWYANMMWTRFAVDVQTDRVNFELAAAGSATLEYTIDYQILDYRIGV